MKITIGDYELVSTQARNNAGLPVGPDKLRLNDTPGIVKREFVGKTRIEPEDVKVHSGVCTFDVHRTFATVEDALEYIGGDFLNEVSEGEFKIGNNVVFAKAGVSNRTVALVGCTVAISYTIEG